MFVKITHRIHNVQLAILAGAVAVLLAKIAFYKRQPPQEPEASQEKPNEAIQALQKLMGQVEEQKKEAKEANKAAEETRKAAEEERRAAKEAREAARSAARQLGNVKILSSELERFAMMTDEDVYG